MKKLISAIIALTASIFTTHAAVAALQADTLCLQGSVGKLFAVIDRPSESPQPLPLVIIAHGFNDSGLGAFPSSISQSIVRQGMATLRFDFNAHGRSEGEFKNMTVLNEIADLKSVIAWAQQQPWVKDIALVGHSQGGVVVSMTAGELGYPTIKAEVLLAP
ncbi:MAG: alpha/beta fold hydrolase, partial [Muribaculaceae bacterium]|nr:alpha/beta fold hydrolase [Muribaculaceae bacterium]